MDGDPSIDMLSASMDKFNVRHDVIVLLYKHGVFLKAGDPMIMIRRSIRANNNYHRVLSIISEWSLKTQ